MVSGTRPALTKRLEKSRQAGPSLGCSSRYASVVRLLDQEAGQPPRPCAFRHRPGGYPRYLADTFILTADFVTDIRIRPAGTRICALFARVGVVVTVGKTQGRVVRHIEDGFAIEFMRLQHPDFVEDNITGE